MNEAWIALAAALLGGGGLKTIEIVLQRPKTKTDVQAQLRNELREEISALRAELHQVNDNLRFWRERYYEVMSTLNLAKSYLAQAGMQDVLPKLEVGGDRKNNHTN